MDARRENCWWRAGACARLMRNDLQQYDSQIAPPLRQKMETSVRNPPTDPNPRPRPPSRPNCPEQTDGSPRNRIQWRAFPSQICCETQTAGRRAHRKENRRVASERRRNESCGVPNKDLSKSPAKPFLKTHEFFGKFETSSSRQSGRLNFGRNAVASSPLPCAPKWILPFRCGRS